MFIFHKNNSSEPKNLLSVLYVRPVLYAFLALIVSQVVLMSLIQLSPGVSPAAQLALALLPMNLFAFAVFLAKLTPAILQLGPGLILQWKTETPVSVWRYIVQLLQVIGASFLLAVLTNLAFMLMGHAPSPQPIIQLMQKSPSTGVFILSAIGAMIAAPISEEFLFRLGIYQALSTRFSPRAAAFATSLLFALCHGEISVMPSLLGVALLFQHAKNQYGLRQSILLHAGYNSFQMLFMFLWLTVFKSFQ